MQTNKLHMPELKRCSNCGGEAKLIEHYEYKDRFCMRRPVLKYGVKCVDCGKTVGWYNLPRGAAVYWNSENK